MAGPCAWNVVVTDECCPGWSSLSAAVQARSIRLATKVVWAATGRRYGVCSTVIRPCGADRRCGSCGSWDFFGGWMRPMLLDGLWRNCLCGCACDCTPNCQITLPGWVNSVTQVTVDGVIIAASSWRVDNYKWLVRTDGDCWPNCQDFNVDSPTAGTMTVSYGIGESVPQDILDVTAVLACEFAKACAADKGCRLPGRLQTLTRQGVTVSNVDIDAVLKYGLTGITDIDMVIMADNPYGLKQKNFLYSYDTAPRYRVTTQA